MLVVIFLAIIIVILRRKNAEREKIEIPKRLAEIKKKPIPISIEEMNEYLGKDIGQQEYKFTYQDLRLHLFFVWGLFFIVLYTLNNFWVENLWWVFLLLIVMVVILANYISSRFTRFEGTGIINDDMVEIRTKNKTFMASFNEINRLQFKNSYRSPQSLYINTVVYGKFIQIGATSDRTLGKFYYALEKRYKQYIKRSEEDVED